MYLGQPRKTVQDSRLLHFTTLRYVPAEMTAWHQNDNKPVCTGSGIYAAASKTLERFGFRYTKLPVSSCI